MKYTLDEHVQKDPRILDVYLDAKRRYGEFDLYHHNFPHVMRDLYRALVIAEDEGPVDYSVLIPSVLLHDIGFCSRDFKRLGHDVAGARLAQEILVDLDYDEETYRAISHCILAHKGKIETPRTIEAKILYDADVLEKAGLIFSILGGKLICEFRESIHDFLKRELSDRAAELERGFYTRKARELDGGRLKQIHSLFSRIKSEILEERPDYGISEQDVWIKSPAEVTS